MSVVYTEQENGNLKVIAEVEGIDNPALAVDALLDDAPRLKEREFVVIDFEAGTLVRVTVDDDEPVNPRRSMTVTGAINNTVVEDEPAPAPRRQRRASSSKRASKRGGARKTAAKKAPAKKRAAKKRAPAAKKASKRGSGRKQSSARPSKIRTGGGAKKASPFKTRPDDE